jgi:hypothetical protein
MPNFVGRAGCPSLMISGLFVPHHKKFLGIFLIGSPLENSTKRNAQCHSVRAACQRDYKTKCSEESLECFVSLRFATLSMTKQDHLLALLIKGMNFSLTQRRKDAKVRVLKIQFGNFIPRFSNAHLFCGLL